MNSFHQEIFRLLLENSSRYSDEKKADFVEHYCGTPRKLLEIKTAVRRKLIKNWCKKHVDISDEQFLDLLDSLYSGELYDERILTADLLSFFSDYRKVLPVELLGKWILRLEGWAEIDNTCQSGFTASEVLARWNEWQPFLTKLSESKSVSQRRASLVLLVKPIRESDDLRLQRQAFITIEKLMIEKDILITKAISWLLRQLITHHISEVAAFLDLHSEKIPKIALRETRRKLETGKK
ncbi:MAG: hypothetical protein COY80_02960 [Candidatus Pacebacteria bacterium CG_4_10_14_0_8_um_filter_42_14]|nr:MAG: hypothetical protein COY80_02960 [Candidatus Pacebacteria bacterium CG_4_10_14_0_8_um_filter_42_14]